MHPPRTEAAQLPGGTGHPGSEQRPSHAPEARSATRPHQGQVDTSDRRPAVPQPLRGRHCLLVLLYVMHACRCPQRGWQLGARGWRGAAAGAVHERHLRRAGVAAEPVRRRGCARHLMLKNILGWPLRRAVSCRLHAGCPGRFEPRAGLLSCSGRGRVLIRCQVPDVRMAGALSPHCHVVPRQHRAAHAPCGGMEVIAAACSAFQGVEFGGCRVYEQTYSEQVCAPKRGLGPHVRRAGGGQSGAVLQPLFKERGVFLARRLVARVLIGQCGAMQEITSCRDRAHAGCWRRQGVCSSARRLLQLIGCEFLQSWVATICQT